MACSAAAAGAAVAVVVAGVLAQRDARRGSRGYDPESGRRCVPLWDMGVLPLGSSCAMLLQGCGHAVTGVEGGDDLVEIVA